MKKILLIASLLAMPDAFSSQNSNLKDLEDAIADYDLEVVKHILDRDRKVLTNYRAIKLANLLSGR